MIIVIFEKNYISQGSVAAHLMTLISQLASHPMCEISTIHQHTRFNPNSRSRRSLGLRTADILLHACAWTSPFEAAS